MINGFIYILCLDLFQHKIIRVQNSQISLKGNMLESYQNISLVTVQHQDTKI